MTANSLTLVTITIKQQIKILIFRKIIVLFFLLLLLFLSGFIVNMTSLPSYYNYFVYLF